MTRHLAIGLGLLALSTLAQDTEVKGARVSLMRKPGTVLNVTIENRRDSPLVAWQIGLSEPGTSFGRMTHSADFSGRQAEAGGASGPIGPHERRTLPIELPNNAGLDSPVLQLAAFQDGHSEGIAVVVEPWRKTRQARVDELRYWNGVFELMPRVSETDLRAYLASHLADRAGQPGQDSAGMTSVSGKLRDVLRQYSSGPDVWPALDRLRTETRTELALTPQPSVSTPAPLGAVTSVAILTHERVASTTLVAALENLRSVPIEAIGFETVDAATNRAKGGWGMDFCLAGPGTTERGQGRIQPQEIREFALGGTVDPNAELPLVRLSFVIFDDLSYEGRTTARDEILHSRERQAEDYSFAIAALGQATARPVDEISPFLMEKRAERAKQLQTAGGGPNFMVIDELIRQAKDSPDRLLANAKRTEARLELERQRLVRHVRR